MVLVLLSVLKPNTRSCQQAELQHILTFNLCAGTLAHTDLTVASTSRGARGRSKGGGGGEKEGEERRSRWMSRGGGGAEKEEEPFVL